MSRLEDTSVPRSVAGPTDELSRRPARSPDHAAEARAFACLADTLAEAPQTTLQRLAELALEQCTAGSAAVSLRSPDGSWRCVARAGRLGPEAWEALGRADGPCPLGPEQPAPLLLALSVPENPPLLEALQVPIHTNGRLVGVVQVVRHSPDRLFDAEDVRLVHGLSRFAAAAAGLAAALDEATAARRVEEALRQSEETLALAIAAADLGTWVWDPQTDAITLSDRAAQIFGTFPQRVCSREWLRGLLHPDHRDQARNEANRAVVEAMDYELEYRLARPGAPTWVATKGRGVYDAGGVLTRMLGVVQDVSARKQAEDDLRESEERHRKLADNLPSGYIYQIVHGPVGERRFTYVSGGVEAVCGVTPAQAMANPMLLYAMIHPEDQERVQAVELAAFQAGGMFDCQFRIRVDGQVRWLHCRSAPRPLPDGGAVWDGITLEVTASKRLEAERERLLREVEVERLQAGEALRKREQRALDILESITDAFFSIDRDWRFIYVNRQAEQVLERQSGDLVGRILWDEYPGLAGTEFEPVYRAAMEDARPAAVTAFYPDHERWYEVHAYPSLEGIAIYFRNVTERVQGQLALRDSEARYREAAARAALSAEMNAKFRAFFEQGTHFAAVLARDGTVIEPNRASLELCGLTRADVIGKPFWECGWWAPSAVLQDRVRAYCQRAAVGQTCHTESAYFTADGAERCVDLTLAPVTDDQGRVLFVAATGTDTTERKQAEEERREQADRMRLLWEAAAVLLTTEEPEAMMRGLFSRIAPRFRLDAYFNFMVNDAGDALRLESCQGIPEEAAASIRRLEFNQAVCGTVAARREPMLASHIQQSDDPRVQLVKGYGIRCYACNPLLAGDHLLGTLSFASRSRDTFDLGELEFLQTISHYVTLAYERLGLVRELRAADRKKDDFIALLAHELRNPLAPLRNGLQVLRLAGANAAAANQAWSMMDRQLSHMVRLIDDLLDISRVSRGRMELRREPVLLSDIIDSAVETARPLIVAGGHEWTLALPPGPIFLHADLTRLAQVFGNLLTNSAKYTPRGGHIRLSAERDDGHVVVRVQDDGIGIPRTALTSIFDMFSQVDRTVERNTGGLGIGLALVKGLVAMHGGTVTAESAGEGRGSVFTVRLPILEDHSRPANAVALPNGKRTPRRVLVVDDHEDGAETMAMMLRMLGDEVRTAHDGIEAERAAEQFRPEVILMDVGMPRRNGLEATRRIREHPWGRALTIIAVTGWGQENDREKSRAAGCDGHLVKPVNLPDLEKLLSEVKGRQ